MGTYSQPGQQVSTSAQAAGKGWINLTAMALKSARSKRIDAENEDKIRTGRINDINASTEEIRGKIQDIKERTDYTLDDEMREKLNTALDEVHKLGVESIGEDNAEYLKAKNNLDKIVTKMPEFFAGYTGDLKKFKNARLIPENEVGAYMNNLDPGYKAFMDNSIDEGGSNVKVDLNLANGTFNLSHAQYDQNSNVIPGTEFGINTKEYVDSSEEGNTPLIEYVEDHSHVEETLFNHFKSGYESDGPQQWSTSQSKKVTTKGGKNYDVSTGQSYQDWEEANNKLRNNLMTDDASTKVIRENANANMWAYYGGKGTWEGSKKQLEELRKKITTKIMDERAKKDFIKGGTTYQKKEAGLAVDYTPLQENMKIAKTIKDNDTYVKEMNNKYNNSGSSERIVTGKQLKDERSPIVGLDDNQIWHFKGGDDKNEKNYQLIERPTDTKDIHKQLLNASGFSNQEIEKMKTQAGRAGKLPSGYSKG